MVIDIDGDLVGEAKASSGDEGSVVVRQGGCCRIRRKPETPRPCSSSGIMGGRTIVPFSVPDPASKENRIFRFSESALAASDNRLPVLRFFGSEMACPPVGEIGRADTLRVCPASSIQLCILATGTIAHLKCYSVIHVEALHHKDSWNLLAMTEGCAFC